MYVLTMRSLGILCTSTGGLPEVHSVLVVGDQSSIVEHQVDPFSFIPASGMELPKQLSDLSKAFESYLSAEALDAAIVRTADFHRMLRVTDGLRNRFHAEGVLMERAVGYASVVRELSGLEVGQALGVSKSEALSRGEALAGANYKEIAAAALAGIQILA